MARMTTEERKARAQQRKAETERLNAAYAETLRVVTSGKCPKCGSKLVRNSALTGWWQCEQFGSEQFRARPSDAPCSWQGFTR